MRGSLRILILLLGLGISNGAGVARAQTCIALGYGRWFPATPEWLPSPWFERPPHLWLHETPIRDTRSRDWPGWYAVGAAPDLRADTLWTIRRADGGVWYRFDIGDVFGGWRAPRPDSLELRRLAGLSWEIAVLGRWSGDTLRARAHSYSDSRAPDEEPRANAYAIRYPCHARGTAAAAARALRTLLQKDRPDTMLARREAQSERRSFDEAAERARAATHRP